MSRLGRGQPFKPLIRKALIVNVYTLAAGTGSFALAGQDASLLASRLLTASVGTYALTGQDATLTYTPTGATYTLTAGTGTFTLAGQTATLTYSNQPTAQKLPSWYYVPGTFTFDADGVRRELQRISQASYGAAPVVQMIPQALEPSKPRDGMTVYADGTNWNPGSGAGMYFYASGAWVPMF